MSKRFLQTFDLRLKPKGSFNKQKASPSVNGLLNLPPELWLEIFTHIAALSIRTGSVSTELQETQATYCVLWHEKTVLSDAHKYQDKVLFATRCNIVLVCKAWYQLGISTLYSHVMINMVGPLEKLESLCRTIKQYPSLASSVVRLSIIEGYKHDITRAHDSIREQILALLLPLLTNVRIFISPFSNIRNFYSVLHPEVIILSPATLVPIHQRRPPPDLLDALRFAEPAHTLFFQDKTTYRAALPNHLVVFFPPLEFPNLVNLRLQFLDSGIVEWLVNGWTLPRLRTLSVACNHLEHWIKLVQRHADNIEALEITPVAGSEYEYDTAEVVTQQAHTIHLPNLTKLCIHASKWQHKRELTAIYLKLFIAPRLIQLCYQIPSISDWFHSKYLSSSFPFRNDGHYLKKLGDDARETWPTVRELSFSYWSRWSYLWQEDTPRIEERGEVEGDLEHKGGEPSSRIHGVYHTDTEADRLNWMRWLVEGWIESDVTVIMKYKQMTELVFPRQSEGGIAAMREYRD